MNTYRFAAATIAALSFSSMSAAALAQAPAPQSGGHYEWRQVQQPGPRTPLAAPHRVWVPDGQRVASCNCDDMKMSAADSMMQMRGMSSPSAAITAG